MDLECEKPFSVDFNKEVDSVIVLHVPSAYATPASIVARVRKRLYSSTRKGALSRKKLKTFVSDDTGRVIAAGFHNENPVHKETTDESQLSSKQHIYGANESCIVDTGSDVNRLVRKHLRVFEKAGISFKTKNSATPFTVKGAFVTTTSSAKQIVTLSALRLATAEGRVEFKNIQLYLLEEADEIILGLPFTDGVGFNINS